MSAERGGARRFPVTPCGEGTEQQLHPCTWGEAVGQSTAFRSPRPQGPRAETSMGGNGWKRWFMQERPGSAYVCFQVEASTWKIHQSILNHRLEKPQGGGGDPGGVRTCVSTGDTNSTLGNPHGHTA